MNATRSPLRKRLARLFTPALPLLATVALLALPAPRSNGQAGQVDPTFDASIGLGSGVFALAIQSDGKVLACGVFSNQFIARVNPDGSRDRSFNPGAVGMAGVYDRGQALALQSDGRIIIGGHFASIGGGSRNNIARLNPDGTLDAGFNPGSGAGGSTKISESPAAGSVQALAIQPGDGKVIVGGDFSTFNGVPHPAIVRLNPDGSLDPGFDSGAVMGINGKVNVQALAIQSDGKVVFGGIQGLVRLLSNGSPDPNFNPGNIGFHLVGSQSGFQVNALASQPDGKLLVGGFFDSDFDSGRNTVLRLNADGSVDPTFVRGAGTQGNPADLGFITFLPQPNGKVLVGGSFQQFNGSDHPGLVRLNADGSVDGSFQAQGTAGTSVPSIVEQPITGKLLVAINRSVVRLNADGSLDATYSPPQPEGPDGGVSAFLPQGGGNILIVGNFTTINGIVHPAVARLTADGGLDSSFTAGMVTGGISTAVPQPDGKLLLGGNFGLSGRRNIARLNPDGSFDSSFDARNATVGGTYGVTKIILQADGKILVSGDFNSATGALRTGVLRLNADGSLDSSFDPGETFKNTFNQGSIIFAIVPRPDGKILAAGFFDRATGAARDGVALLNNDGRLDSSFDAGAIPSAAFSTGILTMVLQPDNQILIGGQFNSINGVPRGEIARLNPNGSLDASFNPGSGPVSTTPTIDSIQVQPADGKIYVSGGFNSFNGVPRNNVVRLNPDGSVDPTFNPGTGTNSRTNLTLLPSGDLLVGGGFTMVQGATRNFAARLSADGVLDTGFNPGAGLSRTDAVGIRSGDGLVLIGGSLGLDPRLGGDGTRRIYLARLNSDGTTDSSFHPGLGPDGVVSAVLMADDGSAVIGGEFTTYNGQPTPRVAHIYFDGTLDRSFRAGTDAPVRALARLPGGKLALGGEFSTAGGRAAHAVSVVDETTGNTDPGFSSTGASGAVYALAADEGGRLLVGGLFDTLAGMPHANLGRLNADGSDDASFDPGDFDDGTDNLSSATGSPIAHGLLPRPHGRKKGSNGAVTSIVHLPAVGPTTPATYVAGAFSQVGSNTKTPGVAKLNAASGQPDTGFNPGGANGIANARPSTGVKAAAFRPHGSGGTAKPAVMAVSPTTARDGSRKLVLAGQFSSVGGKPRNNVARVNADTGALDLDFDPGAGADGEVRALSVQPDGKTIIGGAFSSVDTQPRSAVARLLGDSDSVSSGPVVVSVVGNAARGGFVVSRTGSLAAPVTVRYHNGGSAVVNGDYQGFSGSVTLAAGQSEALIAVNLLPGANRNRKLKVFLDADGAAYGIGKAQSKVFLSDL